MPKPRVLLVADKDLIREAVAELLIDVGCIVTEAYSAEMALGLLEKESRFDLLLTDLHMTGDLNGIDVTLCARFMWPELPVVFIAGSSDVLKTVDVSSPRPGCVAKPHALGDLLAMIGITSRSTQNRTPANFQTSLSLAFQLDLEMGP